MKSNNGNFVFLESIYEYDSIVIDQCLQKWYSLFAANVFPGNKICLKPNWLAGQHKDNAKEWCSVITHPTLITAILKIVFELLQGKGSVIVVDAPQTDSKWDQIMSRMQVSCWQSMASHYGVSLDIFDLREEEWTSWGDIVVAKKKLPGDPLGSVMFDLKDKSEFYRHQTSAEGFYGASYDTLETKNAHCDNKHRYRVSKSVISSDVFINIPKLKTHKKAGITCSLKNLVGINTYKNYLPHYTIGSPRNYGDQYPLDSIKSISEKRLIKYYKKFLNSFPKFGYPLALIKSIGKVIYGDTQKTIRSGNWYGNDTIWRTILDLNKILFYGNIDGTFREATPQNRKRYISIVDAIISGDGNGPEAPDAIEGMFVIAGQNPVTVDSVAARMFGFDYKKIPSIYHSFSVGNYSFCDTKYDDIFVHSSDIRYNKSLKEIDKNDILHANPHFGWKEHIELQ